MVQKEFWEDKTDKVEIKHLGNEGTNISHFYHYTGIVFWPPQIKHHKYIGKSLPNAIRYIKTLKNESDTREVALLIIRKLKKFTNFYFTGELFSGDLYDLYEILFRYNLNDQVAELAHFLTNFEDWDMNMNVDAIESLNKSYPTLSTNSAFQTLVTSVKRKLELEIADDAKKRGMYGSWCNEKKKVVEELERILSVKE